jgi:hypothetical protein
MEFACDRFDLDAALRDDEYTGVEQGRTLEERLRPPDSCGAADQFNRAAANAARRRPGQGLNRECVWHLNVLGYSFALSLTGGASDGSSEDLQRDGLK